MHQKSITSIICITLVTITALLLGYDSYLLYTAIAALSGLGGFFLAKKV